MPDVERRKIIARRLVVLLGRGRLDEMIAAQIFAHEETPRRRLSLRPRTAFEVASERLCWPENRRPMDHNSYPDGYIRGILNTVKTIAMVGVSPKDNRP